MGKVAEPDTRTSPHPVDKHVGARVRLRRTLLGFSQEKLGNALGLTFQQVQKYERGANRIGSSRLYEISKVLDVPISFFFEEFDDRLPNTAPSGMAESAATYEADQLSRRETLELVRAYYRISDPAMRRKIFDLIKTAAS